MIRYVEPEQLPRLLRFLERDALGVKIAGCAMAYGVQPFAEYWILTGGRSPLSIANKPHVKPASRSRVVRFRPPAVGQTANEPHVKPASRSRVVRFRQQALCRDMDAGSACVCLAVIGRLDSTLTLCADPALFSSPDLCTELETFCRMLPGIRTILFPKDLPVSFHSDRAGIYMEKAKTSNVIATDTKMDEFVLSSPSVTALYELLSACRDEGIDLPSRSAFLVDMSHRFRHGVARCWAIRAGDEYRAVVFTTAETPSHALIGGVATHPDDRGQGMAARLLAEACRTLFREGKTPRLFCVPSVRLFYERLGFSVAGHWADIVRRKQSAFNRE